MVPNLSQIPFEIQKCFEDLTMIEEQLISPVSAIMSIFRLSGGHLFNRGYCASFTKDLGPICHHLPRLPKDISIIVITTVGQNNNQKQFEVNRHRVEVVLKYLCMSNDLWKAHGISINYDNLAALPENAVPDSLNVVTEDHQMSSIDHDNGPEITDRESDVIEKADVYTYIESDHNLQKETDKIKAHFNFPTINSRPVNEYEMEGIISLVFPKLFPDCLGDPTFKVERNLSVKQRHIGTLSDLPANV